MIYSKRVRRLFDYDGQRLVGAYVDVATVAAPNLRRYPNLDEDLALKDIAQKVLQTLRAFKANGVRVRSSGLLGVACLAIRHMPSGKSLAKPCGAVNLMVLGKSWCLRYLILTATPIANLLKG